MRKNNVNGAAVYCTVMGAVILEILPMLLAGWAYEALVAKRALLPAWTVNAAAVGLVAGYAVLFIRAWRREESREEKEEI